MLSFFPLDVLDEIWYLIESVSEGFLTYSFFSKFRPSSHDLNIETGRHWHFESSKRKCSVCDTNDIEDEFHFILTCPLYENIRKVYINMYYYRNPRVCINLFSFPKTKI